MRFSQLSVSLYRKYRPQDFASVVGQKPAVSILTNALTKGTTGHAYLFSGSRGCGKTSIARIFAKALNCLNPSGYEPCGHCRNCLDITAGECLDVVEIDGASNNGIDNIRNIRSNVNLSPFSSKHKIYIIDEVHMLSQGAFNALLKTLEEPPDYVVFIMATTEPHKVPITIRSRCQHIPFHSISTEDIAARLEYVCRCEGIHADSEALHEIARQADGALRDGLSLLEQVISAGEITLVNVEELLGAGSRSAFEKLVSAFRSDPSGGYVALKNMLDNGASPVRVFEEMFSLVMNMWLVSRWKGMPEVLALSNSERRYLADEVPNWSSDSLHFLLDRTLKALTNSRKGFRTDILLGSFMLSLAKQPVNLPQETNPLPHTQNLPQEINPLPQTQNIPQETKPLPQTQVFPPTTNTFPQHQTLSVNCDNSLKAEILQTAHDNDFSLFCALMDVRPALEDKGLVLDVEHVYCYHRLTVDQTQARLRLMFSHYGKYGDVFLRHNGHNEVRCPLPRENPPVPMPDYPQPKPQPQPQPITIPQEILAPMPPEPEHKPTISGIRDFRRELSGFVKVELLMKIHHDTNNTDFDIQEGDNDD